MRKALISSREILVLNDGTYGMRIAEIQDSTFDVHNSLFWVDCEDNIDPRFYGYRDGQFIELPPPSVIKDEQQPISEGTQEL